VVAVNEDKHVLAWDLVKNRDSKTITRILFGVISRMSVTPKIIITDDFSSYKKELKLLQYDHFEIGITYAYHNYINYNNVKPLGNAPEDVAKVLDSIAHKFKGKCITTNIIEREFSTLKSNIKFKGKRIVARWKLVLNFLFHGERISRAGRRDNKKDKIGEKDGWKVNGVCIKFNRTKVKKSR